MKQNDSKKQFLTGAACMLIGIILMLGSASVGGTNVEDFISGIMIGVGCGCMLVGVYVIVRNLRQMK